MTVRRDLDELEKSGKLLRVHGGSKSFLHFRSRTFTLKSHSADSRKIAATAASLIHEGETIFLGPGTTIELLATHLLNKKIRIITNNYPVFDILAQADGPEILLIGGDFRKNTGAFVGPITNDNLRRLKFTKAFISSNGVHNEAISTYSTEEGAAQQIALNNSRKKYLLVDNKNSIEMIFMCFIICMISICSLRIARSRGRFKSTMHNMSICKLLIQPKIPL